MPKVNKPLIEEPSLPLPPVSMEAHDGRLIANMTIIMLEMRTAKTMITRITVTVILSIGIMIMTTEVAILNTYSKSRK